MIWARTPPWVRLPWWEKLGKHERFKLVGLLFSRRMVRQLYCLRCDAPILIHEDRLSAHACRYDHEGRECHPCVTPSGL